MTEEQQWKEAMDAKIDYESKIQHHNEKILLNLLVPAYEYIDLIDGVNVSGKMEYVKEPQGELIESNYTFIGKVFTDQWAVGTEGDSFEGTIFAEIGENKWLSIPFTI